MCLLPSAMSQFMASLFVIAKRLENKSLFCSFDIIITIGPYPLSHLTATYLALYCLQRVYRETPGNDWTIRRCRSKRFTDCNLPNLTQANPAHPVALYVYRETHQNDWTLPRCRPEPTRFTYTALCLQPHTNKLFPPHCDFFVHRETHENDWTLPRCSCSIFPGKAT